MFDKLKTKWNEMTNPEPLRPLTPQEMLFKANQIGNVVSGVTNAGVSLLTLATGIISLKQLNNSRKM